jgi:dihydroorotase
LDLPPSALKIGYPADICLVDLNQETSFEPEEIASKSKNTPWLNQKLSGKVIYTILDGRITWEAI